MSIKNLSQNPLIRNGQPHLSRGIICCTPSNNNRINPVTVQQALLIPAQTCDSILLGQPHQTTFVREDLRQTLVILTQMIIKQVIQQCSE